MQQGTKIHLHSDPNTEWLKVMCAPLSLAMLKCQKSSELKRTLFPSQWAEGRRKNQRESLPEEKPSSATSSSLCSVTLSYLSCEEGWEADGQLVTPELPRRWTVHSHSLRKGE